MIQNLANVPMNVDVVLVASVKCQKVDHATLSADLTHLMGEAQEWVGGLASS